MGATIIPNNWEDVTKVVGGGVIAGGLTVAGIKALAEAGEIGSIGTGILTKGSAVASASINGIKSLVGSVASSSIITEAGTLLTTEVGAIGSLGAGAVLTSALACFGAGIVGYQIGDSISDCIDKIDPDFWYNFYSSFLGEYGDSVPVILDPTDNKTYITEDVLNWTKEYLVNAGIFETAGVTYYNFTKGSNTITNLFDYNVLFNEANKLATAEKFRPQYILNKAKAQGYDVPEITPNDLVIWAQSYGYHVHYKGYVYISKNVLNKTFNISESTNMPNSQYLCIPYNHLYTIQINEDEKITFEQEISE